MNEVVYPATGTLDDWAYAAGRFPSIITKCDKNNPAPYPKGMAQGLVFLIEMGPHNAAQYGSQVAFDLKEG